MSDPPKTSLVTEMVGVDGSLARRRIPTYSLRVKLPSGSERTVEIVSPLARIGSRKGNDLVIRDKTVSRLHFEISVDELGHRLRDLGSTNGTVVDGYRTADIYLHRGSKIQAGKVDIVFALSGEQTSVPASRGDRFGPVLGRSLAMRELFALLERAAPSNATILVEGETGTGKELIARAIHEASPRAGGPFVVFDCSAVAPSLLESELFGHEKGAFTGASSRHIGRLEEADGGTLFIDEVGELPTDLQPRLLRALEQRETRRLGGTKVIPVDVRIVAATNRDLALEVNRGSFREDLYYRLAVVRVVSPPLRERPEDIRDLVTHFIRRSCAHAPQADKLLESVQLENWKKLEGHPWPGNVRELRNMIERTVALSTAENPMPLDPGGLPRDVGRAADTAALDIDLSLPLREQKTTLIARFETAYLEGQLERHDHNISRAAAASGMDRMYFKKLLKKYRG